MKIIFDSEEQKRQFIKLALGDIMTDFCPGCLGLNESYIGCMGNTGKCEECWDESGLEMEVKINE